MANPLLNAPPRLSDLRGEERAKALRNRHEANKARWLEGRRQTSFFSRLKVVTMRKRVGRP